MPELGLFKEGLKAVEVDDNLPAGADSLDFPRLRKPTDAPFADAGKFRRLLDCCHGGDSLYCGHDNYLRNIDLDD
jgi:hypothetical protein